jgi:hypothetical protein
MFLTSCTERETERERDQADRHTDFAAAESISNWWSVERNPKFLYQELVRQRVCNYWVLLKIEDKTNSGFLSQLHQLTSF